MVPWNLNPTANQILDYCVHHFIRKISRGLRWDWLFKFSALCLASSGQSNLIYLMVFFSSKFKTRFEAISGGFPYWTTFWDDLRQGHDKLARIHAFFQAWTKRGQELTVDTMVVVARMLQVQKSWRFGVCGPKIDRWILGIESNHHFLKAPIWLSWLNRLQQQRTVLHAPFRWYDNSSSNPGGCMVDEFYGYCLF